MSQPIQLTASLALTETGVAVSLAVTGLFVALAGSKYVEGIQNVPTTAGGTAIPGLASLANLGYALLVNLDTTNYVEILTAVSGTAFIKLLPGDAALFRFDPGVTAPAALAHTAAVNLQYFIIEN